MPGAPAWHWSPWPRSPALRPLPFAAPARPPPPPGPTQALSCGLSRGIAAGQWRRDRAAAITAVVAGLPVLAALGRTEAAG
jgi:hypothetical protein